MVCEYCSGSQYQEEGTCCGDIVVRVHEYRRHVIHTYIIEAIFDMVVSTISVILDITTLAFYLNKGKWELAILTTFPIILPTTVFTNVYMTDDSRAKVPKNKARRGWKKDGKQNSFLNMIEERSEGQRLGFVNCLACWSGTLHSLFHKDRRIRKRGAKLARKSVRRTAKYFFGTLVLRFIGWAWYLKAIVFGVKAMRQPQKFMKMEQPDEHWSRELLIRLDFLQAALENAPQCVIQLYTLLTQADENKTLGILTLSFSFIDFIRVATTVFWNINKGPVMAPEKCYGSLPWQMLNIFSWIFLYMARCCGLGLVFGTSIAAENKAVITVPIIAAFLHCILFAKLFSAESMGQASKKFVVTTFISIFFLPELDITNVNILIQFYYAMTLLENTMFVIPWRGLAFSGYCIHHGVSNETTSIIPTVNMNDIGIESSSNQVMLQPGQTESGNCLIDPVWIVVLVPAFTMIGIVMRLASIQQMNTNARPSTTKAATMEDRIAKIYNKKWTKMTVREMWSSFMRMLRKEVTTKSKNGTNKSRNEKKKIGPFRIEVDEDEMKPSFLDGDDFIYKSCQIVCHGREGGIQNVARRTDNPPSPPLGNELACSPYRSSHRCDEDPPDRSNLNVQNNSLPRQFFTSASYKNFNNPGSNILQNLDVRFLKVQSSTGIQVFETSHI